MSTEVDYYDVERMVEDEASRLRAYVDNAIRAARADLQIEIADLRTQLVLRHD